MERSVNVQLGRWKHICRISSDVANINLTRRLFTLMSFQFLRSARQHGCSNNNNNRFMWTNEETKNCLSNSCGLVLFPVCKLYFFYILLQPCYGTLPIPPSFNKASGVHPLQPLDRNAPYSHSFFVLFFWQTFKRFASH